RKQIPMVTSSGQLRCGCMAEVQVPAREFTQNGTGVGTERNSNDVIHLCLYGSGAVIFRPLVQLGFTLPTEADDGSRPHAETSSRKYPDVHQTSHHQCGQRILERKNPVGEVHGTRIPQPTKLHQCDLLSLRRPGFGSVTH